jgi:FAD/FMN-containing dehydrogenase
LVCHCHFPFFLILALIHNTHDDPGVDNVLQFTIVLDDGSLATTNSFQFPNLFWALRGGGGGTYEVITSTTYQTHPIIPFTLAYLISNFTSPAIAHRTSQITFNPL